MPGRRLASAGRPAHPPAMSKARLASAALAGLAALVAALVAPAALEAEPQKAAPGVAQAPLEIHAEHLDLDLGTKAATSRGKVTITKGDLALHCARVDVRYDDAPRDAAGALRVTWIKGSGGVTADVKGVHAEAPDLDLDASNQVLTLKGGVRITRAGGWITAERATVHIATGKVSRTDVRGSLPVGALPAASGAART